MAYTKYSLTPSSNTAAPPDGAPEGMLPSAVNDTMRDMMAQIRDCGDGIRDGTYTMTAPKITGGTITGAAFTGNTFTSPVISGGTINNATIGATTATTGKFTTLEATGVATFSAGTVSLPAITTTGDTNTGIYFPTADTIAFTEGGAEAMRIDSSGNVGIGTSSPAYRLEISSGSTDSTALFNSTSVNGSHIRIASSGTVKNYIGCAAGFVTSGSADDLGLRAVGKISFATNGAAADMTLDASGNVGIGTSSPTSLFHVAGGNIRCDGANGSGYKTVISVNSGADRDMFLAGISGVTNGFTIQYVNSGTALSVKFANITTTASAANAFLDSGDANRLYRSTSSIRYKKDIESIEKSNSDAVLNLRPVWYRSKADDDKKEWSWYGLIAEEVAEVEPRLVHWSYLDSDYDVTEENGSLKKTPKAGAKLVPDGVQYDRVVVLLLDVVKRQEQAIQEQQVLINQLTTRLNALEGN